MIYQAVNFKLQTLVIVSLIFMLGTDLIDFKAKMESEPGLALAGGDAENRISPEFKAMIEEIWKNKRQEFINYGKDSLGKGDIYFLYNIQIYTNSLLRYCYHCKDYEILDELVEVFLIPYDYLTLDKDGYRKWVYTYPDDPELKNLIGYENKIVSAQYTYLLSSAINIITSIDKDKRTAKMNELIDKFVPIIINDHYKRWCKIYSAEMMEKLNVNYPDFSNPNPKNPKNYYAVQDWEMRTVAGVVEILSAHSKEPSLVPIPDKQKAEFLDFVDLGTKLIKSRLTESDLTDFMGNPVKGLNFDLGMWDEYGDNAYSGYTGEAYPTPADKKSAKNVGWDISHARRFVENFDTLYDNRDVTGQSFPDRTVMEGLANQLAYGVFNKDFGHPLFTNYLDGTNGWYRVGYLGRQSFGYGPYKLSNSVPTGGYGFWSKHNPDIKKILLAFWDMVRRGGSNEPGTDKDREVLGKYYGDYYNRKDSLDLLMFLPSMVNFDGSNEGALPEDIQELDLYPGWNLFSIYLEVADNKLSSILASIEGSYSFVYTYDAFAEEWKLYSAGAEGKANSLTTIEPGKGYWIYMNSPELLNIIGKKIDDSTIPLKRGWNLVGFNSPESRPIMDALSSISGKFSSVWTYDSQIGWLEYSADVPGHSNSLIQLSPGRGYWIKASEDCIWSVGAPNPG